MILKREIKMSNVLIGITGSIAAYKACELIRFYKKQNDDVKVVLTPSSLLFIGEKTLETLTGNPVYYDMFNPNAAVDFASSSWPMIIGIVLTIFGAWMFFSHHTKIGKISSLIVPFMATGFSRGTCS